MPKHSVGKICLTWRFSDLQTSCSLDIVRVNTSVSETKETCSCSAGKGAEKGVFQHAQHTGSNLSSYPIMSCLDSCSRSSRPCQSLLSTVLISFLFTPVVYGNSMFLGCLDPRHQAGLNAPPVAARISATKRLGQTHVRRSTYAIAHRHLAGVSPVYFQSSALRKI
jgi:hypothetical protein